MASHSVAATAPRSGRRSPLGRRARALPASDEEPAQRLTYMSPGYVAALADEAWRKVAPATAAAAPRAGRRLRQDQKLEAERRQARQPSAAATKAPTAAPPMALGEADSDDEEEPAERLAYGSPGYLRAIDSAAPALGGSSAADMALTMLLADGFDLDACDTGLASSGRVACTSPGCFITARARSRASRGDDELRMPASSAAVAEEWESEIIRGAPFSDDELEDEDDEEDEQFRAWSSDDLSLGDSDSDVEERDFSLLTVENHLDAADVFELGSRVAFRQDRLTPHSRLHGGW